MLCGEVGTLCFTISTDVLTWTLIYADSQWFHIDVSSNDQMVRDSILLEKLLPSPTGQAPEATKFFRELLIPSAKN